MLLSSTDLYLTPYRSREQIVSGALTFAIVAGCPVVSTPYFYAEDLLAIRGGRAGAVRRPGRHRRRRCCDLLDDPDELRPRPARGAAGRGRPGLASGRAATLEVLARPPNSARRPAPSEVADRPCVAPSIRSDHLLTLVDDVGIIQHADGVVPEPVHRLLRRRRGAAGDRRPSGWIASATTAPTRGWWPGARRSCGMPGSASASGMHNMMSYDRQLARRAAQRRSPRPRGLGARRGRRGAPAAALTRRPSLRLLEEMVPACRSREQPARQAWRSRCSDSSRARRPGAIELRGDCLRRARRPPAATGIRRTAPTTGAGSRTC